MFILTLQVPFAKVQTLGYFTTEAKALESKALAIKGMDLQGDEEFTITKVAVDVLI